MWTAKTVKRPPQQPAQPQYANCWALLTYKRHIHGCCFFTGPWTVTRASLRMSRRVAAFCRPLRPVLLLVSFLRLLSPVVWCVGAVLNVANGMSHRGRGKGVKTSLLIAAAVCGLDPGAEELFSCIWTP